MYNLLINKSANVTVQLIRYTIVGGFAFLIDFSLLYLLAKCVGLHYIVSASISFIAGLLTNYFISVKWVFTASKIKNRKLEFLFFALIGIIGLILNDIFLYIFTDVFKIYLMYSKIISAALIYLWNFFARKYLIFNVSKNNNLL
jgi:putative flippase GtrA